MSEMLSKPATATLALTYGGTPVASSIHVGEFDCDVWATIFDATGGADAGRRLGVDGLADGTIVLTGWLKADSGIAFASPMLAQETDLGSTIELAFGTATGTGGGGPTKTLTLRGKLRRFRFRPSKNAGNIVVMTIFQVCGVLP